MIENTGLNSEEQNPQSEPSLPLSQSESETKVELSVKLAPVVTAIRAALDADPSFTGFREIAEAEMRKQLSQLEPDSVEYRVNLQKIERNALTGIFIDHSVQELFKDTEENPESESVVWHGADWQITVDGTTQMTQQTIQEELSARPYLKMAIYIYHDQPEEEKIWKSQDKPIGFDMVSMSVVGTTEQKQQVYEQSPGLVPLDGYSCVSFAMIRAYDQVLQDYLEEIKSDPSHPMRAITERLEDLLANPNPEEAELDGLFMRYSTIKDFILPAFGFAVEFYAALARFVENKLEGKVTEDDEAQFFTAFTQALNIPSFIAKYHNAVFHELIDLLTDGMENAVVREGALDTKTSRSGVLQATVNPEVISVAEKFHIPETVTTGCPALTTEIFKRLLLKYKSSLQTVGYKNLVTTQSAAPGSGDSAAESGEADVADSPPTSEETE